MEERNAIEVKLAASLKSLAVRHPFEKITIKQITDGAGVIRVTFYNHFQDKYDLLEWIMRTEILEPVRILLANSMFREAVVLIFRNMQKDKDFYMHMDRTHSRRWRSGASRIFSGMRSARRAYQGKDRRSGSRRNLYRSITRRR